jgi:Na+-translocating ferredoxin:NAD+ oxidoreductase RnfD subunit
MLTAFMKDRLSCPPQSVTMDILQDPQIIAQLSIALFLAIVFLQSALDKVFNWSGNLSWLKEHFSKTFLASTVAPMLATVTIVELITGGLALCGAFCIVFCEDNSCVYYALLGSLLSYLMLIFGQRIAQDYDGAKTIAIYFGVSLIGLLSFI